MSGYTDADGHGIAAVAIAVQPGQSFPISGAPAPAAGVAGGTVATELNPNGSVAAAANNQTLTGAVGKRTYITSCYVDGLGATGASVITVTITGLKDGTYSFNVNIPAGVGVALAPVRINFPRPIPASADNTAIVVNVPSFGAGNTQSLAGATGYQL